MEDVLEVYHRPYDPKKPQVCFDEGSKQQTKETRQPLPAKPGALAKYDYEYERNGTSNMFIFFAPLEAWRHVKVTDQRTMIDFAEKHKQDDVCCQNVRHDAEYTVAFIKNADTEIRKRLCYSGDRHVAFWGIWPSDARSDLTCR